MASQMPAGASQQSIHLADDYFNHLRIARLALTVGSTVLLELVYSKIQSHRLNDLSVHLKNTTSKFSATGLYKTKLRSIATGSPLKESDLDVSFLAFILNNTLQLTAQEKKNIGVITAIRNNTSHVRDVKMTTVEFQKTWQELSQALVDISRSSKNKQFEQQTDVDIKNILSEQATIQLYKETWRQLNSNEKDIEQLMELLDAMDKDLQQQKGRIQQLEEQLSFFQDDFSAKITEIEDSIRSKAEMDPNTRKQVEDLAESAEFKQVSSQLSLSITREGKDSEATEKLVHKSCDVIASSSKNIQGMSVCYKDDESRDIVFLAELVQPCTDGLLKSFGSFEVKYYHPSKVSAEGKDILNSQEARCKPFTEEEFIKLQKLLPECTKELMQKHSNLTYVSACTVKSTKYSERDAKLLQETCIVLYVPVKGVIPLGEEPFVTEYGGFVVDVREGDVVETNFPAFKSRRNLLIGCRISASRRSSIQSINKSSWGSLGPFVQFEDGQRDKIGVVTCAHVVLDDTDLTHPNPDLVTDPVQCFQPGNRFDRTEEFGKVVEFAYKTGYDVPTGIDAALIEIEAKEPRGGYFPRPDASKAERGGKRKQIMSEPNLTGFTPGTPLEYHNGDITEISANVRYKQLIKYGANTGLTRGKASLKGIGVRRYCSRFTYDQTSRRDWMMMNQIEVLDWEESEPFCEKGDSGALVLLCLGANLLSAVGILTCRITNGATTVQPIHDVLAALGLDPARQLMSFPHARGYAEDVDGPQANVANQIEEIKAEVTRLANAQAEMNAGGSRWRCVLF